MSKPLTNDEILDFMNAVYPDAGELSLASFDEGTVIRDATATLIALRAELPPVSIDTGSVVVDDNGYEYIVGPEITGNDA